MTKIISWKLQFIDDARFMAISSNLVSNLAEEIHKIKCKHGQGMKKCETCRIKKKTCGFHLAYTNVKDDLILYKCLCCNRNYKKKFDENLKKRFADTYKFSIRDINKFILLLQKGIHPYE